MAFIRPEITRAFWRWREAAIGAFVAICGMVWVVTENGLLSIVGMCLAVIGSALIFAGIQRTRFRMIEDGPGVVVIDERMVIYYGPLDGGSVSIDALASIELEPGSKPVAEWVLTELSGQTLHIPVSATNAEALFDVFAALDGIETEAMLSKLRSHPENRVVVWHQKQRRLH